MIKNVNDNNKGKSGNGQSIADISTDDLIADDAKWSNIVDGRVATCCCHTRIDFVFCNKYFFKVFDVVKVEHLKHNNASNHVLVRVHCEY